VISKTIVLYFIRVSGTNVGPNIHTTPVLNKRDNRLLNEAYFRSLKIRSIQLFSINRYTFSLTRVTYDHTNGSKTVGN